VLQLHTLRPIQALAASLFFKHKKLMLNLPRQYGGKTELGVRLQEDLCFRGGSSTGLFVAKNSAARKKATREKFLRIFDPKIFAVNTELIYNKKNQASQIFMASIDKDPSAQRGGTVNLLHWSEVAFSKMDHGETIPDVWQMVLNPMLSQTDGYALLESTNNGNNGWKDIWEMAPDLGFKTLRVTFSQMLELGLVTQEEFDKEKRETHPLIFAQEYECQWVTFQGLVYDEFDEPFHVADIDGPAEWQKTAFAIDWGYHPSATCVLFGYVHEGTLNVFDELYVHRQLIDETAASLHARRRHWLMDTLAGVADHEEDRNEELIRRGIGVTKADKTNVLGNRLQIKEMLWKGTLKIHPRCVNLIKDLKSATWHDKKEGDLDYSLCSWGHYDAEAALRYLVRAFEKYEEPEPEKNPHLSMDEASARAWEINRGHE